MMASELEDKLQVLRVAYAADHAECERGATLRSATPHNTCRYCGRLWRHWRGSTLDGHAQCMVSDAFKVQVADLLSSPHVRYEFVASALGVTVAVVRGWLAAARIRRSA